MAPEVAQNLFYTESADVYSFAIILWQVCALKAPYGNLSGEAVERKVVHCGYRPPIDQAWPPAIGRLLKDCFASHPRRPSMETVCSVLKVEINKLSDKPLDDDDLIDSARSAMSARYYN
jgi:serine/threonine protein kinase